MPETYVSSREYADRLGVSFGLFRQAMAHKRGALGGRGGAGYASPQVRRLAERIAPPTTSYPYGKTERPLWSLADIEAHESRTAEALRGGDSEGGGGITGADAVSDADTAADTGADVRARRGGGAWPAGLGAALGPARSEAEILGAMDLAGLSGRERLVLERRYGGRADAPTQREVAEELGISQPLVSLIEREALAKVGAALEGSRAHEPGPRSVPS